MQLNALIGPNKKKEDKKDDAPQSAPVDRKPGDAGCTGGEGGMSPGKEIGGKE